MTQDAICPGCSHTFPVTEARKAFTAICPRCEIEMTLEFKKPAKPPEPGQPPFELVAVKGGLPVTAASGRPKKERKYEDDEEGTRKGGSARIAFISGGLGLLFVFCSLGLTAWLLFTQVDTDTTWDKAIANSNPGGNKPQGGGGNTPGPNPPQQPKDTFELRPVNSDLIPGIAPPADLIGSTAKSILLPGTVGASAIGGGGRYILFHFPQLGRIALFDVNRGDLLPLQAGMETGDALLTAGANVTVFSVPNTNKLRVCSLPEFKTQKEFEVPLLANARVIAMGARTNGPVLAVNGFGDAALMDLTAGKPIEGASQKLDKLDLTPNSLRASAEGKVFLIGSGYGNDKFKVVDESARKWRVRDPDLLAGYIGPDGRTFFGRNQILTISGNEVKQFAGKPAAVSGNVWYVPPVTQSPFFLRVNQVKIGTGPQTRDGVSLALHKDRNVDKPLLTWDGLDETEGLIYAIDRTDALDKRLFLIPEAKLLVILNREKNKLVVRKLTI